MPDWLNTELLARFNLDSRDLISDASIISIEVFLILAGYFVVSILLRLIENRLYQLPKLEKVVPRIQAIIKPFRLVLRLVLVLGLVGVIGINATQFYLGEDLKAWTLMQVAKIPPGFWGGLAINLAKVIGLVWLARFLVRKIRNGLEMLKIRAVEYKQLRSNDQAVGLFFDQLIRMQRVLVWLLVTIVAVRMFPLTSGLAAHLFTAMKVYIIVSLALLVINAIAAIVDSLDGLSMRYAEASGMLGMYQSLRHLVPLLRRTLEYLVYASAATLILKQLSFIGGLAEYGAGVIQGIGILFLSRVAIEVLNLLIDRRFLHDDLSDDERRRNETIYPVLKSVLAGLVYFVALVLIMRGFGFDPIPLLAGAGILGMVIGLGAQSLITNLVSGFSIIFEQTYQVGDFIQVQEAKGVVEMISLRTTRIRSPDGELHILENGNLGDIVNYSNKYTNAIVEIGIDADSDLNRVYGLLTEVGKKLKEEHDNIVDALQIDGIEDFSGPELVIRTRTKVLPGQHSPVSRIIRQEIMSVFEREKILIPFKKRYKLA